MQPLANGSRTVPVRHRAGTAIRTAASLPGVWPVALVIGVVVAGNLLFILGFFDPNPLYFASGLGIVHGGLLPGSSTIDPNSGTTAQSLGHLAMLDIVHGRLPWWNPYEGAGAPLAGEMQSAAFFPPNVLLVAFGGQLPFHMLLEASAGLATYALVVRLDISRWIAAGAGCAFALDGTFAWFRHAAVNPIALLPLLVYAIERARVAAAEGRRGRWALVAVALALSIYAGFPEVAYLDAIFAGLWILVRCIGLTRAQILGYVRKLACGIVVGIAVAAPIVVAFTDYLSNGYLGAHGTGFDAVVLDHPSPAALFFPYIFGPIFGYTSSDPTGFLRVFWDNVGGYLTTTLLLCDLVALYARRLRSLRIALVAWIVVAIGRIYGIGPLHRLFDLLPIMNQVAAYRYLPPSVALASAVLAALAIDDLRRKEVPRWFVLVALAAAVLIALALLDFGRSLMDELGSAAGTHHFVLASLAWGFGLMAIVAVAAVVLRGRWRTGVLVGLLVVDALAMFVVPELSAPRSARVDMRLVDAVKAHTGLGRFYTFQPFTPNYGSYFGFGEADVNDLPLPKAYVKYIRDDLDTNVLPNIFIGDTQLRSTGPTPLEELVKHFAAYERMDIRVIVSLPGFIPAATVKALGLKLVYSDNIADVYVTPHPSPFYSVVSAPGGSTSTSTSTSGPACVLSQRSVDQVVADCKRPALLVRRELSMKGWTATVGGRQAEVGTRGGVFQEVSLPAGRSDVSFSFTPPHEEPAFAAFLVGLVAIVGGWVLARRGMPRFVRRREWGRGDEPRDLVSVRRATVDKPVTPTTT